MLKKILTYVKKLLKKHNLSLILIDVGSSDGILELADLAEFVEAYGFEPNPAEFEKLLSGKTDTFLKYGTSSPNYRRLLYYPYALGNIDGKAEFYITPGPSACGLIEPNLERLKEIVWKIGKCKRNFAEDVFAGYKKIEVEVQKLDTFVSKHSIKFIDYLKIDVEGSEYEVLEGACSILPNVGVIKVETCFIPFRKGQKLFSHIDLFLRDFGFELLNYEIRQRQVGYKERFDPIAYKPLDFPDPFSQPLNCDAIYINCNLTHRERLISQAMVLLDKNYVDEGLHILRTKAKIEEQDFLNLLRTIKTFGISPCRRLRGIGYWVVDKIVNAAKMANDALRFLRRKV